MGDPRTHFEESLWPHLGGAYNLARWIVGNRHDAEDVVQDSFTKAFQAAGGFRGGDIRVWLMKIVRNTALNFVQRDRPKLEVAFGERGPDPADAQPDPEAALLRASQQARVRAAVERLPAEFRETLVLRELEGMAYKEIAAVLDIPIGTVMSRLARARDLLMRDLAAEKGAAL
ncbi:MAG TPA: sigma-70 family RNA polymerase sigma factor [Candidatus Limnocylindrales bacterium]|nr:sigma-70 family RNA polymerase sigma factor [Candidatus Limnocylindrales bacterium]